mmetsp:Transcript_25887/g.65890  ORF Transcript_25887/g.65890 Transcript_25887/m.65890 type:complete len:402 (+) Transcript_25887:91-1296(+)
MAVRSSAEGEGLLPKLAHWRTVAHCVRMPQTQVPGVELHDLLQVAACTVQRVSHGAIRVLEQEMSCLHRQEVAHTPLHLLEAPVVHLQRGLVERVGGDLRLVLELDAVNLRNLELDDAEALAVGASHRRLDGKMERVAATHVVVDQLPVAHVHPEPQVQVGEAAADGHVPTPRVVRDVDRRPHLQLHDLQGVDAGGPSRLAEEPLVVHLRQRLLAAAARHEVVVGGGVSALLDLMLPQRLAVAHAMRQLLPHPRVDQRHHHLDFAVEVPQVLDVGRRDGPVDVEVRGCGHQGQAVRGAPDAVASWQRGATTRAVVVVHPRHAGRHHLPREVLEALGSDERDEDGREADGELGQGGAHLNDALVTRCDDVVDEQHREGPDVDHDPGPHGNLQDTGHLGDHIF